MDERKRVYIRQQVNAILQNLADDIKPLADQAALCCFKINDNAITDQNFIANLHGLKLAFLNIGKAHFEKMESLKRLIEAHPEEPEFELKPATEQEIKETTDTYFPPLPITNEDLLDDNPVEGVDY